MQLNQEELEIYSRQLLVKGWGLKEQMTLKNSTVVLSVDNEVAARYLIGAGIGSIVIKSKDLFEKLEGCELNTKIILDLSENKTKNLQILQTEEDNNMISIGISHALDVIKQLTNFKGN